MREAQAKLTAFMEAMQPGMVPKRGPGLPGKAALELGPTLLTEEFNEAIEAMDRGDVVEVARELADVLYVTLWNCVAWGIDIQPVFDAIHVANMAKADGPVREDGKRERPDGWKPADIAGIIRAQMLWRTSQTPEQDSETSAEGEVASRQPTIPPPFKRDRSLRAEVLERARDAVSHDRVRDYGSPENNFGVIRDLWNAYLGDKLGPMDDLRSGDVAAMLALLKIGRLRSNLQHGDSWVDLAGYAACGAEVEYAGFPVPTPQP